MVVNSGHGVHLYWRLLEPILDLEVWTSIQKLVNHILLLSFSMH